jgi:acetyltransferase EpsM
METEAKPVLIPLLNPNEPEANLASISVEEGQHIEKGAVLCTLETTKTTAEVEAQHSGYIVHLRFQEGQTANAGDILCYLADSPDWKPPDDDRDFVKATPENAQHIPEGLRITQPALSLARQENLDLNLLPLGPLITESMVSELMQSNSPLENSLEESPSSFNAAAIVIYGGGGHGKKLVDLIRRLGSFHIIGILDDGIAALKPDGSPTDVMGVPILGGGDNLPQLHSKGVQLASNGMGGIGNPNLRIRVFHRLADAGMACPALIDPSALVEASAVVSAGVQVFPLAYVGSLAKVGFGVIVNNNAVISHDCHVGNYANISPGALVAGSVEIGEGALIGMGATIHLGVKIGRRARIGNGATVKASVPENGVVQAGAIWPK